MSDQSFLDAISDTMENGDIPDHVNRRMVLAALRNIDGKIDKSNTAGEKRGSRLKVVELWQSRANGAIKMAVWFVGGGLGILALKLLGVF